MNYLNRQCDICNKNDCVISNLWLTKDFICICTICIPFLKIYINCFDTNIYTYIYILFSVILTKSILYTTCNIGRKNFFKNYFIKYSIVQLKPYDIRLIYDDCFFSRSFILFNAPFSQLNNINYWLISI